MAGQTSEISYLLHMYTLKLHENSQILNPQQSLTFLDRKISYKAPINKIYPKQKVEWR